MTILPGAIDPHVHFRQPGQAYKEGIANASKWYGMVKDLDVSGNVPISIWRPSDFSTASIALSIMEALPVSTVFLTLFHPGKLFMNTDSGMEQGCFLKSVSFLYPVCKSDGAKGTARKDTR